MPDYFVTGTEQMDRLAVGLFETADDIEDLTEPLIDIARDVIQAGVAEQFATEGARTGGWRELTPKYAKWKEKRYPGEPKLQLNHTLIEEALSLGAIKPVEKDEVLYELTTEYAAAHQHGAVRSRGGILFPRPLLDITVRDEEEMARIMEDWFEEKAEENL